MPSRPAPGRTPARDTESDQGNAEPPPVSLLPSGGGAGAARTLGPSFHDEGRPSKTQLKREAHELQQLGKDLALMPEGRLMELQMSESLRDAVLMLRRTRSHEGRRRQLQYVGKLMRQADAGPLREAVAQLKIGPAQDSLKLHETERWRTALLDDDEALTRWANEVPGSDLQRLRSLVRSARAELKPDAAAGLGQRQGKAFRELFQFVSQHLGAA